MTALLLLLLPALASAAETIHGAALFSRHGDRTAKVLGNPRLTVTGQNQLFNSGSYWRQRYLLNDSATHMAGISSDTYDVNQIYAAAPDNAVLAMSGQAFLQGFYPPTTDAAAQDKLTNGSMLEAPLGGFQYTPLHTVSADSPETIWLQGSDDCTSYSQAGQEFYLSPEYTATESSTKDFYQGLYHGLLEGVFPIENCTYKNAYTIFDYLNAGAVHNETIASALNGTNTLSQLRTLADSHEYALNGNSSDPIITVAGQTLSHQLLGALTDTVSTGGKQKLNIFYGSYDTFQAFFSLMSLPAASTDFFGLPDYGSMIALELLTLDSNTAFPSNPDQDLYVRFLFRNGTTSGEAKIFPLFGHTSPEVDMIPWATFKQQMSDAIGSVNSTEDWCSVCGASVDFCLTSTEPVITMVNSGQGPFSRAVAGVIGAVCALAVVALAAILAALMGVRFARKQKALASAGGEEAAFPSGGEKETLGSSVKSVPSRTS